VAAAAPSSNAPIRFGKYILEERLGCGGMAEVWRTKLVGLQGFERTMVIKRILPHLVEDPDFVDMFLSEALLSARLNHANIVPVYELGKFEDEYYIAMEYVRGRDLMSIIRTHSLRGPLPVGFAAYLMREVARALGYAHALTDDAGKPLQIIHRDVSPSNVMVSFDGAVKLLDFGIAKALSNTNDIRTATGTLKGKFGYLAPEQVLGKEIDHRADLFSAGVLLYECLTARRLFKGVHDMQTLEMVRDAKVEATSVLNPEIPKELDEVCLKALAKEPGDRFRDGEELAAALEQQVLKLGWGPEKMATLMRSLFPEGSARPAMSTVGSAPSNTSHQPRSASTPRRRRRRRRILWAVAGVALLGAGVGAGLWMRAAPMAVNTPVKKSVFVDSEPSGAEIFVDNGKIAAGTTPYEVDLSAAHHISVRQAGFATVERELGTGQAGARIILSLHALSPAAPTPPTPSAPTTPTPATALKSVHHDPKAPVRPLPKAPAVAVAPIPPKPVAATPAAAPAKPAEAPKTKKADVVKGDFVDPFDK